MPFPMVQELLGQLFKKPNTNPFPAAQLRNLSPLHAVHSLWESGIWAGSVT